MVSVRKRQLREAGDMLQVDELKPSSQLPPDLRRLRNTWQFASLCQWLYIFGGVIKIDSPDIDELEVQCLGPYSTVLQDIGLALLKYLSSHRGLTHDLFDEYTRRQFSAKAPGIPNPFGTDEIPAKFSEFTVFQKVRILHQMTLFVMMNPEKLREKMAEQKDADHDQTSWRIEPFGWDRNDRAYYVLDDNRVYRMTETPLVPVKPKKNTKKARAEAKRSSKRRRVSATADDADVSLTDPDTTLSATAPESRYDEDDDGLGGMKWECVAVSLGDLRTLLAALSGKGDANERILREKLNEHLLPILEQQEERRTRREKEREREMLNLAKLATAKRSSRIASRQEQQKQEEAQREEEMKRRRDLEAWRKEEQTRRRLEKERDNRLLSREARLREREIRRAQHEEELAQLSEGSRNPDSSTGRLSERRRMAEIERNKEALKELDMKMDEEWVFDCICGLYGRVDDGQHSVSCERCNIWQHSKCLGIDEQEAEKDDFHFICDSCRRRAHGAGGSQNTHPSPRLPLIKTKVSQPGAKSPALLPSAPLSTQTPQLSTPSFQGSLSGDIPAPPMPGTARSEYEHPRDTNTATGASALSGVSIPPVLAKASGLSTPHAMPLVGPPRSIQNGEHHSFASPHIGLPQPDQSPRKAYAYSSILEQRTPSSEAPETEPAAPTKSPSAPLVTGSPASLTTAAARVPAPTMVSQTLTPALAQTPAQTTSWHPPTSSPLARVGEPPRPVPSFVTPRLQYPLDDSQAISLREKMTTSPLLPSHGGLSPTKHSPTAMQDQTHAFSDSDPAPPIMPPAASLSPMAPMQNLTPPVKHEAPTPVPVHRCDATSSPTGGG